MEPEGSYRVHKTPPLVPILNQMNAVHTYTTCFFKIHLRPGLPSDLFHLGLQTKILYDYFISPVRATCLDLITLTIYTIHGEAYKL
jgi:hypothetical protein